MKNMKGKKGFMAIKVDLEKAYDRLDWGFLYDTLEDVGLDFNLIELIWQCISFPVVRIIWNRREIDNFFPFRGVR